MGTAGSRDIEASRLVPLAAQEEDRADTYKRGYMTPVGDQYIEVDHMMLAEARKGMRKRRMEKWPESCENSLHY